MVGSNAPVVADVLVVGRGPIGASAALAIARQGRRVALIGLPAPTQHQPAPGGDNRVFALSGPSIALLRELGVWQALDPSRIAPVARMRVWPSASAEAPMLEFDAFDSAIDALAVIVEGGELQRVLAQALQFSSVQLVEASVAQLRADAVHQTELLLGDGRYATAQLVLGCDGAQSALRGLSGIEANFKDYGQRAVVANFASAKPHRDTAFQWFGEHGVLALLPLAGDPQAAAASGGRLSMVWSAPHALADELMSLGPKAFAQRVAQASGLVVGELDLLSPVAAVDLRLGRVSSLIGARLALAGDAAHVVHPLAGQGMNLGFGDVAMLVEAIRGEPDPGTRRVLRRYERARAEPVLAMRLLTDGLQRLFDQAQVASFGALATPLVAARDLGWRAVASSAWLRRQLVAQAGRR